MTKQELLDVLKMDEQKQLQWLCCRAYKSHSLPKYIIPEVLAFSLRDKAVEKEHIAFDQSLEDIYCLLHPNFEPDNEFQHFVMLWAAKYATPIEIIIASLIVLEAK